MKVDYDRRFKNTELFKESDGVRELKLAESFNSEYDDDHFG